MSGDVQPRKRKDKKKKKDELGIEEPRGTAAVLGEGDVFIHSYHDHGTGGHWCAKIIFFLLLAVLVTLIGLIILENRGLTELEANSVESRYSGVLEGWLEDAPDDDHHDEHTLELKHPDHDTDEHADFEHEDMEDDEHDIDEDESHEENEEHDVDEDEENEEHDVDEDEENEEHDVDEDEENQEHDVDEDEENEDDEDDDENIGSNEDEKEERQEDDYKENDESQENLEDSNDEDINEDIDYSQYKYNEQKNSIEENNEDELSNEIEEDNNLSNEVYDIDDQNEDDGSDEDEGDDEYKDDESNKYNEIDKDNSQENNYEETEEQNDDDNDDDEEIEHIEREVDDDEDSQEALSTRYSKQDEDASKEDDAQEDEGEKDYLEADDDEPPVERITTPPEGKPFVEIEDEVTEKPINTLAEEEEYEKKQEELRREEAQASHMWLKLAVGGALLVATHALVRRATARRDAPESEEPPREDSPLVTDRRMTVVEEIATNISQQRSPPPTQRQEIEEEIFKKPYPVTKTAPLQKSDNEPEVKTSDVKKVTEERDEEEKELYSDEEEVEEEEEEEYVPPAKVISQQRLPEHKSPVLEQKDEESDPEVPDDVEIIDDEQIEEEEEEDDEEEEISDVDDAELLSRLEAKYGRLPEPERPGKHKDGGNSIEDEWPGEPSESYWREQLDLAEDELRQGDWDSCVKRVAAAALADSARARLLAARALDAAADAQRDNRLLSRAISAYLHLLKMNERISDNKLVEVANRAIDRIQFRGIYLNAEPIYRLLIRRFPHNVNYRNNLTISFLMANRADLADEVLKETLRLWPNDRVALAHYGFVLKNHHNKLEEAVVYLKKALHGDAGAANEARFYYHLGDALLQLGRKDEAHEVHRRGAELGHFLSPYQRSLYNVPRLRSRPWWPVEETPYVKLVETLEKSWREILKEGEAATALYELEKEGLLERGSWSQLDLFVQGREVEGRCARAQATCAAVRAEPAARCRRGQVKFSALRAGSHVRAHTGPTNCRLRLHLALSNTRHTYIRVHDETRQWQVGKAFIFDDSFEHEVWHNGTGTRLVLIVDVWHPDLTAHERRTLPAI